jgi:tripartite-type tricarboxylate transporter receptor subunit TctC
MGPVEAHLIGGKLEALAVAGKQRLASLPGVPTVAEDAIPGYSFSLWYGLVFPAGTPRPVTDRLNAELRRTMQAVEAKGKLASIGGDLTVGSPDEFGAMLRHEVGVWTQLARDAGIKAG